MSELKIKGVLTKILNPVSGTSKAGNEWNKQDFVINTGGKFHDEVCFTLFGDKTSLLSDLKTDDEVEVHFNIASREHEGKYFHNVNAWKIDKVESQQFEEPEPENKQASEEITDDLPF